MVNDDLSDIFDDCLNRLAAGETVEQCLRRYAAYDAALRPLLQTVRITQRALPGPDEVIPAQMRARQRVQAALSEPAVIRKASPMRAWLAVAALLLVAVGVGAATLNALPGDTLYGLKRQVEDALVTLSSNPDTALEATRQRRIDEIRLLVALGRTASVEFSGPVETVADNALRVDGLDVTLSANTARPATLSIGDVVLVAAETTANRTLIAREIRLLDGAPEATPDATVPAPTPTLAATMTPLPPTATSQPSATPVPTTQTPTDSAAPAAFDAAPTSFIATWTPAPTHTPSPTPVETLLPARRPDCQTLRPQGWITYTIRSGDSLFGLANATDTSIGMIAQVNCLPESGLILAGQPIYLPALPPTRPPVQAAPPVNNAPVNPPPGSGDDSSGTRNSGSDDSSGDNASAS